jgi:hypothetical protein
MSNQDLSQIPAKMARGQCHACGHESDYCALVYYGRGHRWLCSGCRLRLVGEWKPLEPLIQFDFGAKRGRAAETVSDEQNTERPRLVFSIVKR